MYRHSTLSISSVVSSTVRSENLKTISVKSKITFRLALPIALAIAVLFVTLAILAEPYQVAYAEAAPLALTARSAADASNPLPLSAPEASLASFPLAAPAELHVCPSGCPYTSVQAALNTAKNGDAILVAQGWYTNVGVIEGLTQTVYLSKSVALRGGYATGNWSTSYPLTQPTVLDARGQGRVIYIAADVTATIEGFSVTNGATADPAGNSATDHGGGIYIAGGNTTLRGNWIFSNTAERRGGGIYIASGNPTVSGNQIHDNWTSLAPGQEDGGGGINIGGGSPIVQDNMIFANRTTRAGGGILISSNYTPTIESNQVFSNSTSSGSWPLALGGGGIYVYNSAPIIRGNAIYSNGVAATAAGGGLLAYSPFKGGALIEGNAIYRNNGGDRGGGIFARDRNHIIQNNLVFSNSATVYAGGIHLQDNYSTLNGNTVFGNARDGIYHTGSGSPDIRNNAVISNAAIGIRGGGSLVVNYNDAWGNGTNYTGTLFGSGNITVNPQFIDPGVDFHPQAGSPLIDQADPVTYPLTDLDGYGRPFGPRADIGALEYRGTGACFARIGSGPIYSDVQALIDTSSTPTGTIKVAGVCTGVFARNDGGDTVTQTIFMSKGLSLRGGYSPTNWTAPVTRTVLDAEGLGRVIYITGTSAVTIDSFVVRGGSADYGGGIYVASALSPTILNVILYSNSADYGGGFASAGGDARLLNNTVVANSASVSGGGLYLSGDAPSISNTIVVSNAGGGIVAAGAVPVLGHNDVWDNAGGDYVGVSAGATDLSVDPRFIDAAGGDFHLRDDSPLIHAGDPNTTLQFDLEGDARPLPPSRPMFDIGADESAFYPNVTFKPKDTFSSEGRTGRVTAYTYTLTNDGTISDTYDLTHSLELSEPSPDWSVTYPTPLSLAPGESRQVQVDVLVGDAFSDTLATVVVTATSATNARAYDWVNNTTHVNSLPAVAITPSFDENLNPGAVMTYEQVLRNAGDITDTYNFSWSRSPGWPVIGLGVIPTQTQEFTLGPFMSTTIRLTLTVQPKASGGLVETVVLTASSTYSEGLRAVVTDTFSVNHVPGPRHVKQGGNDTLNNCLIPTDPCGTIVYAVEQATSLDTVRVAAGTYNEHDISLNKNVTLKGGWNGNFTVWNPQTNKTTIDAQRLGRVLYIFGSPIVEGLTLKGGKTTGSGGGVYVGLGTPVLRQNTIISNKAGVNGGGVYVSFGVPVLEQNVITGNVASSRGGGIYHVGFGASRFEQNVLAHNSAQDGGGFVNALGNPDFWNNLVYRNTASASGGGVYLIGGSPRIWHNTLYTNTAATGGGLTLGAGSPLVSSTIIAGNSAISAGGIYSLTGSAALDYNDVWNNAGGDYSGMGASPNDVSVDPLFMSATTFDLRLAPSSSLVDAGQAGPVTEDYWGDPRPAPVDGAPDIGADEFLLAVLTLSPGQAASSMPGQTITHTHVLTNSGNYTDTVTLTARSDHNWSVTMKPVSVALGIDMTKTVDAVLVIPNNAVSGTLDTVVVTATSSNDASIWAAVANYTTIERRVGLSLAPNFNSQAASGDTKVYSHTLTNTGNFTDTFLLDPPYSSNGFTTTLSTYNLSLPGAGITTVVIYIEVPGAIPTTTALLEMTNLTATPQTSATLSAVVTNTTYINRMIGVQLIPDRDKTGLPNQAVIYTHTLINTGNFTDTFNLAATNSIWNVSVVPGSVGLAGGESRTVTATVTIPNRTVSDTAVLSGTQTTTYITATSQFSTAVAYRAIDTTTVAHNPGAAIVPVWSTCVLTDTPVSYAHTLTNTGNYTGAFDLAVWSSQSWPATVMPTSTNPLAPDGWIGIQADFSVPATATVGTVNSTVISATSQGDNIVRAVVTNTTRVRPGSLTMALTPDNHAVVSESGTVYYTHTHVLTNTGDVELTSINFSASKLLGWGVTFSPTQIVSLSAGMTATLQVRVTVPSNVISATEHTTVNVSANWQGCAVQTTAVDLTTAARPKVNLVPDVNGTTTPGNFLVYMHILTNTGGLTDTYDITSTGSPGGWSAEITPTVLYSLTPGSGAPVEVRVSIPAGTLSNTLHTLNFTATSRFDPAVRDAATDRTTAAYLPGATLTPDNAGQVDPGNTMTYTHRLTNTGNYTETFSLTSQSEFGYAEVSPATVGPLGPGQAFAGVQVVVQIPDHAAGGDTEHTQVIATFAGAQQVAAVDSTTVNSIGGTRYVAPNGSDAHNNCTRPEFDVCATLQHALAQAASDDQIRVAQGVYTGAFTINKSLNLQGGYTSTNWLSLPDPASRPTTLNAQQLGRAITVTGDVTVTIEGFTITNGYAPGANGGAIYVDTGRPITLATNVIRDNAAANGGAIFLQSGNAVLINNIVQANTATGWGGAMVVSGNAVLLNNTFAANKAATGGALHLSGGNLAVTNTIFFSNTAAITGGAVYSNSAVSTIAMDYSTLWKNLPNDGNVSTGANSQLADPLFKDAASGDFHLTTYSPGIDTGWSTALDRDFEGHDRPQLSGIDIGADEFLPIWGWGFAPAVGVEQHTTAPQVYYAHVLTNTGDYTDTANLLASVDLPSWSVAFAPAPTVTIGPDLTQTVRITVTTHPSTTVGVAGTAIVTAFSHVTATATARDVTWYQNEADLAIRKSIAPAGWLGPNDAFTYTLVYTNNGPADAVGVVITDLLPITMTHNLTYTSSGPAITRIGESIYAWSVENAGFVSNTVGVITITGMVSPTPGFAGAIINSTQITTTQNDLLPANNAGSVQAWIDSQSPIILAQPLLEPGHETITFETNIPFSWDASAFSDLSGSGIAGYEFVFGGSLGSAAFEVYSPTTALTINDMLYDVYTWTVRPFDGVGNFGDYAPPFTLTVDVPNLSVTKHATPSVPVAGVPFTYHLTITNTGRITATDMVLSDTLPSNAYFISASPNGGLAGSDVMWSGLSAEPLGGTVQATAIVSACQAITNTYYHVVSTAEGVGSPWGDPVVTTTVSPAAIATAFTQSISPALAGAPVTFTDTTSTDGVLVDWMWDFSDGGNASGPVVSHTFAVSGTYVATLTATDTCGVGVPVTGTIDVVGTPDISIDPMSISEALPRNSVVTRTLTISNTGTSHLTWDLTESVGWLAETPTGGTIVPSGNTSVIITITAPGTAGTFITTLDIASDDPDETSISVPVTLTMQVPSVLLSSDPLNDVVLSPGDTTTRTLTISNTGTDLMTWSQIESASWLTGTPTGGTIAPLGSTKLVFTFTTPAASGVYTTTLQINSDDPFNPTLDVPAALTVSQYRVYLPAVLKNK